MLFRIKPLTVLFSNIVNTITIIRTPLIETSANNAIYSVKVRRKCLRFNY